MRSALIAVGLFLIALPVASARTLENIPLIWKPTTDIVASGALAASATIEVKPLADRRADPPFIAENREDKVPKRVTTKDNVPAWCSEHLAGVLQQSGYHIVKQGAQVIITGELRRFFVVETGNYAGEIVVRLTARNRGGTTLWSDTFTGTAGRFGRSYKADNYYETLSDSLIDVVKFMGLNPGFNRTISSRR